MNSYVAAKLKYNNKTLLCVRQPLSANLYPEQIFPKKMGLYSVRHIVRRNGKIGLLLNEIENPVTVYSDGLYELSFSPTLFQVVSIADLQEAEKAVSELLT